MSSFRIPLGYGRAFPSSNIESHYIFLARCGISTSYALNVCSLFMFKMTFSATFGLKSLSPTSPHKLWIYNRKTKLYKTRALPHKFPRRAISSKVGKFGKNKNKAKTTRERRSSVKLKPSHDGDYVAPP